MIQLRTLALLLATGVSGSVWAEAPQPEQSPPAAASLPAAPQADAARPDQPAQQAPTLYAWDRVGKPVGKESFFI